MGEAKGSGGNLVYRGFWEKEGLVVHGKGFWEEGARLWEKHWVLGETEQDSGRKKDL